ncbi:MAG: hypothetical protein K8W52_02150 [Deltaproteobacteria bacterium]|nr:hypothetical protein [Deltaproteobacteria bacterium]
MRPATVRRAALPLALAALVGGAARAHVAPSLDDNNRYLKLTPLADRVRLAYTVYFGEVPGAAARREIDRNRDGAIGDDEANAFGAALGGQVGPALTITVDGARTPITWAQISVGMGTPTTGAGAFSVDLIGWLCLPTAGGEHTITLVDAFALQRPGETELRIEDSPGVRVTRARLGLIDLVDHDARWQGAGGPIAHEGFTLGFTADDARPIGGGVCAGVATGGGGSRAWMWIAGLVALLAIGAAVVLLARRRKQ